MTMHPLEYPDEDFSAILYQLLILLVSLCAIEMMAWAEGPVLRQVRGPLRAAARGA